MSPTSLLGKEAGGGGYPHCFAELLGEAAEHKLLAIQSYTEDDNRESRKPQAEALECRLECELRCQPRDIVLLAVQVDPKRSDARNLCYTDYTI